MRHGIGSTGNLFQTRKLIPVNWQTRYPPSSVKHWLTLARHPISDTFRKSYEMNSVCISITDVYQIMMRVGMAAIYIHVCTARYNL